MAEGLIVAFHPPAVLDRQRLRRAWQRAAPTMSAPEGLLAQMGQPLLERLDDIRLTPTRILELGDRSGQMARQLQKRWPKAQVCALAPFPGLGPPPSRGLPWQRRPWQLVGEARRLPFARGQFDLVISSMALHWSSDLPAALREVRRVLAADRLFLFTVAGSESLQELHACLAQWDRERGGGSWPRQLPLPSLAGLGDLLTASGFVLPVVDRDRLSLPIPDLPWLLRQLRAMGAGNHMRNRSQGLGGRGCVRRLEQLYDQEFRQRDNSLHCTLELLFGHAWKGLDKSHPG
ncbi:MAG: methyltransferase domain-containing protein [Magnetococcales bacterium]|nr:methyltransferase domain-containing protein [Magnetococcales bacterium]